MSNGAQLVNELKSMASPFMERIITLLSTMQETIDEQKQRIATLEKHCGIEYTASTATNNNGNDITLNLSTTANTPSTSPAPPSNSKQGNDDSKTAEPTVTRQKSNKKSKDKEKDSNDKDSRQSRMERLKAGRSGAAGGGAAGGAGGGGGGGSASKSRDNSVSSIRGGARAGARSRSARGARGGGASKEEESKPALVESSDVEYKTRNLNLLFKTFKEESIKIQGNGKTCKKLDMQSGTCQFGKDILFENDHLSSQVIKYRMIFDTKGSKITSGVGFGIAYLDNFNQWAGRNSGNNHSFHIRGDGKTFNSDGFTIIEDAFENGKKNGLVKAEGHLVCVEIDLLDFQIKIWNYTLQQENGLDTSDECDKIKVQMNENRKSKKLGFIIYLGGGKSKTLSIHSATAFYPK